MTACDRTHDATRRSWVESANDGETDFPLQNLPFGIFSPPGGTPRGGVAIGDQILDLAALAAAGLLRGDALIAAEAAAGDTLNPLMGLGKSHRVALRHAVFDLMETSAHERARVAACLHPAATATLHLPARIGDYTDFYAGINHARNVGQLLRPDQPLMPNYKYVPIGYHGRSSSINASGVAVRRPNGQRKGPQETEPSFGPSRNLDYELELGIWVGPGNPQGTPIAIRQADDHLFGLCLLNDWSARDVQGWEYQPLGPFLAKNFATTLSPWIVTMEALAPFRTAQNPRPADDPAPLPYLADAQDQAMGAFDIGLDVFLSTPRMRALGLAPERLSHGTATALYWSPAQLVTHHASGGCNLNPGDLLGTGTISGTTPDSFGSLLEITWRGTKPIRLASDEERRFLEDGDRVIMRARAARPGAVSIGFGACEAEILPAPAV